jgi:hypothetical protein
MVTVRTVVRMLNYGVRPNRSHEWLPDRCPGGGSRPTPRPVHKDMVAPGMCPCVRTLIGGDPETGGRGCSACVCRAGCTHGAGRLSVAGMGEGSSCGGSMAASSREMILRESGIGRPSLLIYWLLS